MATPIQNMITWYPVTIDWYFSVNGIWGLDMGIGKWINICITFKQKMSSMLIQIIFSAKLSKNNFFPTDCLEIFPMYPSDLLSSYIKVLWAQNFFCKWIVTNMKIHGQNHDFYRFQDSILSFSVPWQDFLVLYTLYFEKKPPILSKQQNNINFNPPGIK